AQDAKKKQKKGTPVYTDTDLKKHSRGDASPGDAGTSGSPAQSRASDESGRNQGSSEGGEGGRDGQGGRAARGDEATWRAEHQRLQAAIDQAKEKIASVQARLDAMNSDLSPVGLGDPFRLQTLEAEKAKARDELEQAQKELALAEQALRDFEED